MDIITDIEQIEGDFSLKYRLEQDGLYDIYVEIEEANIGFNLLVANKSILEDTTFIVSTGIIIIVILLMIRNRVTKIN